MAKWRGYSRKTPKKQRKDGGHTAYSRVESVRAKEVLGEAHELLMSARNPEHLKKMLNSASWQVKKAILLEAIELGNIGYANNLANQILNLTEVKKQEFRGDFTYSERVEILLAEVTGVPFEVLAERAKQIQESKRQITDGQEAGRSGDSADRGGDEAPESFQVLVVEDGAVHEQSLPIRNRNVGRRTNPPAKEGSGGSS